MVLCKINNVEDYPQRENSYFVHFDYLGKPKKTLVTPNVLKYNKVQSIDVNDEVMIFKTFNKDNYEVYLIKDVKKS